MAWTIEYTRSARKGIGRLPVQVRRRILDFMDDRVAAANDPRELGQALSGDLKGLWRYRVGDYRVVCEVQDAVVTVLVLKVGDRKDVYR